MPENTINFGTPVNMNSTDAVYNGYQCEHDIYEFITESYEGSGGYFDAEYIDKFDKETTTVRRAKSVYYKNYIKGIVNSLITPVFSTEAYRETDNVLFEEFIKDADLKGNTLQEVTNIIVKYTRLHSVCFVVVDNVPDDYQPDTLDDAINSRAYPYVTYYTADEVDEYTTDDLGRLQTISFECGEMEYKGKEVDVYRLWTSEYSVRYVYDEQTEKNVEIDERVYHNLGVLPAFGVYLHPCDDVLPFPEVYDLCRINKRIYNLDSEQTNISRLCAFPTLTIQTRDRDINLDIGADSLITYGSDYDGSVSAPAWISPDTNALTVLNSLSNDLVNKLIESANVLGATAISTSNQQAKSGVALSYEFLGQQFALQQTARIAEKSFQSGPFGPRQSVCVYRPFSDLAL